MKNKKKNNNNSIFCISPYHTEKITEKMLRWMFTEKEVNDLLSGKVESLQNPEYQEFYFIPKNYFSPKRK